MNKKLDHWFFLPNQKPEVNDTLLFPEEEATHAIRVLRLKTGHKIQWVNGDGDKYEGLIIRADKKEMQVKTTSHFVEKPLSETVLAVGQLHDATRLEWLIEKGTELGVSAFHLLKTDRVERTRYKMPRLTAKAIAAMKQSTRSYLPQILELNLEESLSLTRSKNRSIAHCYSDINRAPLLSVNADESASIYIGPEGDFTKNEVQQVLSAGAKSVSLGEFRLRTETAAIASLIRLRCLGV